MNDKRAQGGTKGRADHGGWLISGELGSMTKTQALRLRPGDVVKYGSCRRMCDHRRRRQGRVEKVTENGGILVEVTPPEGDAHPWWARPWGEGLDWPEEWVPYDHVFAVEPGPARGRAGRRHCDFSVTLVSRRPNTHLE
jgi:hypothetical protein